MMKRERLYLYPHPDFEQVLIFYNIELITFKHRETCKIFIEKIRNRLKKSLSNKWPYNQRIMVAIGISGPTTMYSTKDVDNMSKSILDAFKGIIYTDDKLVDILVIQKQLWDKDNYGFEIGIRIIDSDKPDKYSPIVAIKSKFLDKELNKIIKKKGTELIIHLFGDNTNQTI